MKRYAPFTDYINLVKSRGEIAVQPRMGFGDHQKMREGLKQVKRAYANTIGTLTIDSYTRVNNYQGASDALRSGYDLNGYPIVSYGSAINKRVLKGVQDDVFPVQVRHGTAIPLDIFKVMVDSGIEATEGGPVSYCLPYSRLPLEKAIEAWRESCLFLGDQARQGVICHLESFAGCMLGQLCPPSLLIALNILEGLFFKQCGLKSISLSFAQGTNTGQDVAAIKVLRQLASEYFSDIDWHVVVYAYMGVFPETVVGAYKLIKESARLTKMTGCERLIVKTPAEAHRIPTVKENIASLLLANEVAKNTSIMVNEYDTEEEARIYAQADQLIQAVLNIGSNLGESLLKAFKLGVLDLPYCLHRDNANKSRTFVDQKGYLQWASLGRMPISKNNLPREQLGFKKVTAKELLNMLGYVKYCYDA